MKDDDGFKVVLRSTDLLEMSIVLSPCLVIRFSMFDGI